MTVIINEKAVLKEDGNASDSNVTSVNNKVGDVVITKTDLGLSNVDNTSDANKPVSNATRAELNNKSDLVDGKVSINQLNGCSLTFNSSNGVITLTDNIGVVHTIDLPTESLFKDVEYNSSNKQLELLTDGGSVVSIDLNDLVDLPEVDVAQTNPTTVPSGKKIYINSATNKIWFNVSGSWVGGLNFVTDSEKQSLISSDNHTTVEGNPHGTKFSDLLEKPTTLGGYGISDSYTKEDVNNLISNLSSTLNELQSKYDGLELLYNDVVSRLIVLETPPETPPE